MRNGITIGHTMARAKKIAISINKEILDELDRLVDKEIFPNRSQAIESAVRDKVIQISKSRLAAECSKLNPQEEQEMADEFLSEDLSQWPKY